MLNQDVVNIILDYHLILFLERDPEKIESVWKRDPNRIQRILKENQLQIEWNNPFEHYFSEEFILHFPDLFNIPELIKYRQFTPEFLLKHRELYDWNIVVEYQMVFWE